MNEKKLLPIGTVVLLKDAQKRLMICGYAQQEKKEDGVSGKIWDYAGMLYPEGFITSDQFFLFDVEQIDKLYNIGYSDDEQKEFIAKVENVLNNKNDNLEEVSSENDLSNNNQEIQDNTNNNISEENNPNKIDNSLFDLNS